MQHLGPRTCRYNLGMSQTPTFSPNDPNGPRDQLVLLLCTFPQGNEWGEIAQQLVGERLCACVSQVRELVSVYRWQGEIVTNREVLCLIKTTSQRCASLIERLNDLHPYDVPEIVRLAVQSVNKPYLEWVMAECDENAPASGRTAEDEYDE